MSAPRAGAGDVHDVGPDIRVHLCTSADRAEQVQLFNHSFKKQVDARALAWRYDLNPHGATVSLLSRAEGAGAVCGYACSPRIALAHGEPSTRAVVGETGDVMTHPGWRKRGLFSALDVAARVETHRRGWPVMIGLPNRRSAHIFVKLGWTAAGTVRAWTFLFRADAASRAARTKEGRLRGWLTGASARRCARMRRASSPPPTSKPLRVEELARMPVEVGALSARVSRGFALMVQRDAAWLTWRFFDSPSGLHRVLGLFDASDTFQGYVVVQLPRPGEAHGYVVDLLADDEITRRVALEAGLAHLEKAGASYAQATAIDGSWWSGCLQSAGFVGPRAENHLLVIVHANQPEHPLAVAAREPHRWYFTDGDRDDETMG